MSPLYLKVKLSLRERIMAGHYKAGQKIPSESELIREFGVSAITVRRALRDLTVEGRLIGRQGIGVFVADQPRISRLLNPGNVTSLADDIRRAGFAPGLKELSFTPLVPEPTIVQALRISPDDVVYRHQKLILADGKPICLDVAFLPRELAERLRTELGSDFLLPLLNKNRIRHTMVDYRVEATSATEREAAVINVPVGAPLLGVHYAPVAPDRRRIFVGHMLAPAEWFSFEFCVLRGRKKSFVSFERAATRAPHVE